MLVDWGQVVEVGSNNVSNLIKLRVGSGNICRTVSSFQRCQYALEDEVGDMERTDMTGAKRDWFVDNRGRRWFERECIEELLVGGSGGGSSGHSERWKGKRERSEWREE